MDLAILIIQGIIVAATPLVFASAGELVVERSGVLGDREPWRPRHEWDELAPSEQEAALS